MPIDGPGSSVSPKRGRRSGSRSPRGASKHEESIVATFEVVDGVSKGRDTEPTWRAEVNLPRPARISHEGMKPGFITIRGPSRNDERDAEDDGKRLVDAAKTSGMEGCRRMQRQLNNNRLDSSRKRSASGSPKRRRSPSRSPPKRRSPSRSRSPRRSPSRSPRRR